MEAAATTQNGDRSRIVCLNNTVVEVTTREHHVTSGLGATRERTLPGDINDDLFHLVDRRHRHNTGTAGKSQVGIAASHHIDVFQAVDICIGIVGVDVDIGITCRRGGDALQLAHVVGGVAVNVEPDLAVHTVGLVEGERLQGRAGQCINVKLAVQTVDIQGQVDDIAGVQLNVIEAACDIDGQSFSGVGQGELIAIAVHATAEQQVS